MTEVEHVQASPARRLAGWVALVILAGIMGSSALSRVSEENRARQAEKDLSACTRNLGQIGSAIESYSDDSATGAGRGPYPATLQQLAPRLLETIPTCPLAGRDTYSKGYVSSDPAGSGPKRDLTRPATRIRGGRSSPHAYTVICTGSHADAGLDPGFPQYTSREGLKTFPVVVRP